MDRRRVPHHQISGVSEALSIDTKGYASYVLLRDIEEVQALGCFAARCELPGRLRVEASRAGEHSRIPSKRQRMDMESFAGSARAFGYLSLMERHRAGEKVFGCCAARDVAPFHN